MSEDTIAPVNDLIDIVEELTDIVGELNPGANEQIRRIRFLIERASRNANQTMTFEE
jgi:hypothetical protein